MVKVTFTNRSQVIEKYLYGFSLSQIAKEVGVSKTTAHNIIQDWTLRATSLDLDDIRIFLSHIRKSGITIQQCVEGYRTVHILKQFGVEDDAPLEGWINEDEEIEEGSRIENPGLDLHERKQSSIEVKSIYHNKIFSNFPQVKNNSTQSTFQLTYFIENLYKNCASHNIKPSIVVSWIKDLFNFYSFSYDQNTDISTDEFNKIDQKNTNAAESKRDEVNEIYHPEIPFISTVSNFIKIKKKNIEYLENKRNTISNDISALEKQKIETISKLNKVIEKQKEVYSYFNWYSTLKQYLLKKYNILIEEEINLFANALQDFKQYRFAATKILSEYKVISSLKKEREQIQNEIQLDTLRRDNLLKEITSLEDQSNYYQQTIKVYQELHKGGLGLKELKQLNYLVMESALANGLEVKDAIKNFLKDVENNYDNKLGFEKKIKELKAEMKKLEEQVPEYKSYLKLQGIVAPTLIHLNRNEVSPEDIIDMNHLVLEFKNNDFLSDPIDKNNYNSNTITNDNMTKSQYWNLFTEKLKKLKNINLEINRQLVNQNAITSQLKDLERKKQEMEGQCTKSIAFLNYIHSQISSSIEVAKQINEGINRKMMMTSRPAPIFVYVNITGKEDDKGKQST